MPDTHATSPTPASAEDRFARNIDNGASRARIRRNPETPRIPLMDSALSSAFSSLIAIEQDILALVYFGGQDQQQIARRLRIPPAAVATAVAHGLQTLATNFTATPTSAISPPLSPTSEPPSHTCTPTNPKNSTSSPRPACMCRSSAVVRARRRPAGKDRHRPAVD